MFQTKIYAISKYNYFTFFYPKPRHLSKKTLYRSNFRQHTVLILAFDLNFLLLDHLGIQRNTSLIHPTTDLLHERHAKLSSNCPSLWGVYGMWFWDGLISARLQAELFTVIHTGKAWTIKLGNFQLVAFTLQRNNVMSVKILCWFIT